MNVDEFWELIDTTREASGGNISKQVHLLVEILAKRSIDEILGFEATMINLIDNAHIATLWDAAEIIGCGCSDDGFEYFRGWLISQGRTVYENALADPESLLDLIDITDYAQEEEVLYIAYYSHKQKEGKETPLNGNWPLHSYPPLQGIRETEETRKDRFPKLFSKFGDCKERGKKWTTEDLPKKS